MLYEDRKLFKKLILLISNKVKIEPGIVEKDYYITMFLELLVKKEPQIVFKGGTSLSKCYHAIQRFSEDIDLSMKYENKLTEGQHRHLKNSIVSVVESFGFQIINQEDIRSRRDYNRYIIDYPSVFETKNIKRYLIVETSFFVHSFPISKMHVESIISDFLKMEYNEDRIRKYSLEPFEVNVQDISRTYIDKLFAIGDYYLSGNVKEHSRHLYDIYKLYYLVGSDNYLKNLFSKVYLERNKHAFCLSAKEGVDLRTVLQAIIDEDIYKDDYENNTKGILFEKVSYSTTIITLQKIVDGWIFDDG